MSLAIQILVGVVFWFMGLVTLKIAFNMLVSSFVELAKPFVKEMIDYHVQKKKEFMESLTSQGKSFGVH